jgi:hypothetical protein
VSDATPMMLLSMWLWLIKSSAAAIIQDKYVAPVYQQ